MTDRPVSPRYLQAAVERAVAAVNRAGKGSRNVTLNGEAFSIGQILHVGGVEPESVRRDLIAAAIAAGMEKREAEQTVRRSMAEGALSPRDIRAPSERGEQRKRALAAELAKGHLQETDEQKISAAVEIWDKSIPTTDPAAEMARTYLAARGLAGKRFSDQTVRFHPAFRLKPEHRARPALVLPCRDTGGEVTGVQVILLKDGGRARAFKLSRGIIAGSPVTLEPKKGLEHLPAVIVEGPEDALSVRVASGRRTYAALSLGNVRHVPAEGRVVVVVDRIADDLANEEAALRAIERELTILAGRGLEVFVTFPPADCKDANDALRRYGERGIDASLKRAQPWAPASEPPPGEHNVVDMAGTPLDDADWRGFLLYSDEGKIKPKATHNAFVYLAYHPDMAGRLAYDAFRLTIVWLAPPPWDTGRSCPAPHSDVDTVGAKMWLERQGLAPTTGTTEEALKAAANAARFDPLLQFVESLTWDRQSRIDTWLTYYLGVEDSDYARAISRRFLVSAVARAMEPGCKVDTMLVLEGPQGLKKSSALRVLFGAEFFTDEVASVDSKDAAMQIQGVWCAEIAEMHAMTKSEANRIKEWLSRQVDRYRPPYGRTVIAAPRRSVVVGTINPEGGYLRDPTGGRRFWPAACRGIDLDALRADREQLWAEAVAAYKAGEQWWLDGDEVALAQEEQEERYDPDAWEEIIARRIGEPSTIDEWSINDFFEMLGIPVERRDERSRRRIGQVLTRLRMKKVRRGTDRAGRYHVYVRRPDR